MILSIFEVGLKHNALKSVSGFANFNNFKRNDMKKVILSAAFCGILSMASYGVVVTPDYSHGLWWLAPEQPEIKVKVATGPGEQLNGDIYMEVLRDTLQDVKTRFFTDKVALGANDSVTLTGTLPLRDAGFYRIEVHSADSLLNSFNIGYEPKQVVSLPDSKPDFDAFWARARKELDATPGNYKMTELKDKSGKTRRIYLAEMTSLGGDTIKGYLAVPVKEGKYPVHIYYNGYGAEPWCVDADANADWIEFIVSSRGQFLCKPENKYGDWIRYNLEDPESYYYRGAYMDCIRAIDFISQLPQADTTRLYAEGGSQGGAYTLVAAALDDRLAAIAPYIPFMSDFPHYFRIVDWPAWPVKEEARIKGLTDEQMYENMSYFDLKNMARRIKCPVLMGIGMQDPTCPPHTNMSSYNLIESPKELVIYPDKGHTVDYSDWSPRVIEFFNKAR